MPFVSSDSVPMPKSISATAACSAPRSTAAPASRSVAASRSVTPSPASRSASSFADASASACRSLPRRTPLGHPLRRPVVCLRRGSTHHQIEARAAQRAHRAHGGARVRRLFGERPVRAGRSQPRHVLQHFRDKDALLATLEDEGRGRSRPPSGAHAGPHRAQAAWLPCAQKAAALLVDLFDYLREQGDFLHAVLGPGGRRALRPAAARRRVHEPHPVHPARALPEQPRAVRAVLRGVLRVRVLGRHPAVDRNGMRESSEEMALIAMRLFFIKPGESITL